MHCKRHVQFLRNSQQNEALENKMKHLVIVKFTIEQNIKIIMAPSILVKFTTNWNIIIGNEMFDSCKVHQKKKKKKKNPMSSKEKYELPHPILWAA